MVNNLGVVIAAAGRGSRMGGVINKQYLLLESRPLLAYALDVFEKMELVDKIIVVAQAEEIGYCEREVIKKYNYKKVSRIIAGGAKRQDSIWAGLKALNSDTDYVAVHDGARPFVTPDLIARTWQEALRWGAAVPGVAALDTMKQIDQDGFVCCTLDRSRVLSIQTPQIFKYSELYKAYEYAREQGIEATDDASLFEKYSGRVKVVPGDSRNFKITTPEDLAIARAILGTVKGD